MLKDASPTEEFWFALRKAATLLERRAEAVVMSEVGVSLGLFMVLSVLDAKTTPVNQQAIAERLGLTKGTVSRLVDNATRDGHATARASETSRRERVIALTLSGKSIVARGDAALAASELGVFAAHHPSATARATAALHGFIASLDSTSQ